MCKTDSLAQHPHGEVDPDQEYEARAILDESKNKYLIQWEDNTVTGEKFNDSWEPKRLANKFLVRDWNETKRQRSTYHPHLETGLSLIEDRCVSSECCTSKYHAEEDRSAAEDCDNCQFTTTT